MIAFILTEVKDVASAALIGDLVGSRAVADRPALHARLTAALADVNADLDPPTPLRVTLGDEFQGVFATVGDAVAASLRLRLALLPAQDVRHGIGWGDVAVLDAAPRVEDGPAWWAARDAIHAVEQAQRHAATRSRRTAYRLAAGADGPDPRPVEAALLLRDEMVGGLSPRSVSVLRGLLGGSTQRQVAEELGISASAVSQRVRADGLAALMAADDCLRGVG